MNKFKVELKFEKFVGTIPQILVQLEEHARCTDLSEYPCFSNKDRDYSEVEELIAIDNSFDNVKFYIIYELHGLEFELRIEPDILNLLGSNALDKISYYSDDFEYFLEEIAEELDIELLGIKIKAVVIDGELQKVTASY